MGFTICGCGTTDRAKKLFFVNERLCSSCNEIHKFYVYEQTTYLAILFLPIAYIKSKFYIGCEHCKQGYVITEEEKDKLSSKNSSKYTEAEKKHKIRHYSQWFFAVITLYGIIHSYTSSAVGGDIYVFLGLGLSIYSRQKPIIIVSVIIAIFHFVTNFL